MGDLEAAGPEAAVVVSEGIWVRLDGMPLQLPILVNGSRADEREKESYINEISTRLVSETAGR